MFGNGALEKFKKGVAGAAREALALAAEEGGGLLGQSKVLSKYRLGQPCATCGPGDVWAIYTAVPKATGGPYKEGVSVWVLDKRRLQEATRGHRSLDQLLEQQRKSCQNMTRLKHPGVIKVVEPLEETSGQMVIVTEQIFGSLLNVLTRFSSVPGAPTESKETQLSLLEMKQGLVHISDTLTFLHSEAGLAHCGICPQVIMLTLTGTWKLAGFGFAVPTVYAVAASAKEAPQYTYNDPFPALHEELSKPSLAYTAPELVGGWGGAQAVVGGDVTPAVDVFSLACVAFELLAQTQLLPVKSSLPEYRARLTSLNQSQGNEMSTLPLPLQSQLHSMLAFAANCRPSATSLPACSFFQDDVLLRGLRFLDTLLQREVSQKAAFAKDLAQFSQQYDERLLRLRVLPPLIQELRNESLQAVVLPVILNMLERVSPAHFMSQLLPSLRPLFEGANGTLLAHLLTGSATLATLMSQDAINTCLVPLFARALDADTQPQLQEQSLKVLQASVTTLDYTLLKTALLPRVYAACKHTTAAPVRVHALVLMTRLAQRLDKEEAALMVETVTQVTSVDRTAPTITCTFQLAEAISLQNGAPITAATLLPLLCPLLVAPSLSGAQFMTSYSVIQGMLERIRSKMALAGGRAGAETDSASNNTATWDTPLDPLPSHKARLPQPQRPAAATTWSTSPTLWSTAAAASSAVPPPVPNPSSSLHATPSAPPLIITPPSNGWSAKAPSSGGTQPSASFGGTQPSAAPNNDWLVKTGAQSFGSTQPPAPQSNDWPMKMAAQSYGSSQPSVPQHTWSAHQGGSGPTLATQVGGSSSNWAGDFMQGTSALTPAQQQLPLPYQAASLPQQTRQQAVSAHQAAPYGAVDSGDMFGGLSVADSQQSWGDPPPGVTSGGRGAQGRTTSSGGEASGPQAGGWRMPMDSTGGAYTNRSVLPSAPQQSGGWGMPINSTGGGYTNMSALPGALQQAGRRGAPGAGLPMQHAPSMGSDSASGAMGAHGVSATNGMGMGNDQGSRRLEQLGTGPPMSSMPAATSQLVANDPFGGLTTLAMTLPPLTQPYQTAMQAVHRPAMTPSLAPPPQARTSALVKQSTGNVDLLW